MRINTQTINWFSFIPYYEQIVLTRMRKATHFIGSLLNECICYNTTTLQILMNPLLTSHHFRPQVWHGHDLDHQARPARKVLRPLTRTRLGIILLPREARFLPLLVDIVDEIGP